MNHLTNKPVHTEEGPKITELHHRLTSCPRSLQENAVPEHFLAVIHDTVYNKDTQFTFAQLSPFTHNKDQRHWYTASMLIAYFLADPCFRDIHITRFRLLHLLEHTAQELASAGTNSTYVNDVDRREEFIRVVLTALGLRPKGETENQAEDRLQAVSSLERQKVLQASIAAEERAHKLRVALSRKKAQEAADKMTRE